MSTQIRRSGFSLLELVVVIVIIGILLAVALNRLLPYIDEAERVGVLTLESQIKSTLVTDAAKRIAGGRSASISELDGSTTDLSEPGSFALLLIGFGLLGAVIAKRSQAT